MSEYIKKEEEIECLEAMKKANMNFDDRYIYAKVIQQVKDMPTADVVEVRHGKWKWASCTYDRVPCEKEYICSCCHHKVITHGGDPWEKYCSNCGAKMDGEEQEHEQHIR